MMMGYRFEAPPPPDFRDTAGARLESAHPLKILQELGTSIVTKDLVMQIPKLLSFLKHDDQAIVRQSISSGTILFAAVLEEMAFQLNNSGTVSDWLEEIWSWMLQFKAAVVRILQESSLVAMKLLAVKFLEICILSYAPQLCDDQVYATEGKCWNFNTARLLRGHPTLDPAIMDIDARNIIALLVKILHSAYEVHGSFVVAVINCLAAVAKNRPIHYGEILSSLFRIDLSFESITESHSASIRYALKTAYLGFLRTPHQVIVESKDSLIRALRSLSPGELTEQSIRQAEKMRSRDTRGNKDDTPNGDAFLVDPSRKRPNAGPASFGDSAKRMHNDTNAVPDVLASSTSGTQDVEGNRCDDASPVAQMIEVIGAFLTQGEDGARSLEVLLSSMHADLMADIVIETMKHLPEISLSSNLYAISPTNDHTSVAQPESFPSVSNTSTLGPQPQLAANAMEPNEIINLHSDAVGNASLSSDPKRDPRRDPRRFDPRRMVSSPSLLGQIKIEGTVDVQDGQDNSFNRVVASSFVKAEDESKPSASDEAEHKIQKGIVQSEPEVIVKEEMALDSPPASSVELPSNCPSRANEEFEKSLSIEISDGSNLDFEENSLLSVEPVSEECKYEFPDSASHLELTDDEKLLLHKSAIERILDDYEWDTVKCRLSLLARLVGQNSEDDTILETVKKYIIFDYHRDKGHELAMHVLYHLWASDVVDMKDHSDIATSSHYSKFVTLIAKSLLDLLPASDKSFNKLLVEAPYLPNSIFSLLDELCNSNNCMHNSKESDGDRVMQGLGTVWNLILVHPPSRQICLDIALKCAVHSSDEIRSKAIRLVANKLYLLPYASERIEEFATDTLLSVAVQPNLEDALQLKPEPGSQDNSLRSSQSSDASVSECESLKPTTTYNTNVSLNNAYQHTALFFALCTKKPMLLRRVFNVYGGAPKTVKQSIHRQLPNLVRSTGPLFTELLEIFNDLPEGSENLVNLTLQLMTQDSTPSADLVGAVKNLYETKLKDVTILIPLLSSLSKAEVLPVFPRLVDLPLEKFQIALAQILQGSAHTGPALTPAEVLIAIHEMDPAKDKVEQKKIIDVCNVCFEQRTVFTQQVLAASLNQLVDKVPVPFLFMRTVIKALDVYPALGDFVMEILSRLVKKQIWKVPKLWVGFLKCAYQTKPKSYPVYLELPPQQFESVLNKNPDLREPLSCLVVQQNMINTLPRPMLKVLGLIIEQEAP